MFKKINFLKDMKVTVEFTNGHESDFSYSIITSDLDDYGSNERFLEECEKHDYDFFALKKRGAKFHIEEVGCEEVGLWRRESDIIWNELPIAVYNKLYEHCVEKAEKSFNYSAAASVNYRGATMRLYVDLNHDDPAGRTIKTEVVEDGIVIARHEHDENGGAARVLHKASESNSHVGRIMLKK